MRMQRNRPRILSLTCFLALAAIPGARAAFDSGSNGSDGPLDISVDTTLALPADGVFHCTTVTITAGRTLSFTRNARNTPVYILATGDITIEGGVSVAAGGIYSKVGGAAGPGGFDGGNAAMGGLPDQSGFGPGAGRAGTPATDSYPSGAYGSRPTTALADDDGQVYGNALLFPLSGGSGGAGKGAWGGGGGGGAVLLASNTRILMTTRNAHIDAYGGSYGNTGSGAGSGGAIRLVAPSVSGAGQLLAGLDGVGGAGRVRIDCDDPRQAASLTIQGVWTTGSLMFVNPFPPPSLRITQAAGQTIADGDEGIVSVVARQADAARTIKLRATGFNAQINLKLVLIPENTGVPVTYDAAIDNRGIAPTEVTVDNVDFPLNTTVSIQAWTTP